MLNTIRLNLCYISFYTKYFLMSSPRLTKIINVELPSIQQNNSIFHNKIINIFKKNFLIHPGGLHINYNNFHRINSTLNQSTFSAYVGKHFFFKGFDARLIPLKSESLCYSLLENPSILQELNNITKINFFIHPIKQKQKKWYRAYSRVNFFLSKWAHLLKKESSIKLFFIKNPTNNLYTYDLSRKKLNFKRPVQNKNHYDLVPQTNYSANLRAYTNFFLEHLSTNTHIMENSLSVPLTTILNSYILLFSLSIKFNMLHAFDTSVLDLVKNKEKCANHDWEKVIQIITEFEEIGNNYADNIDWDKFLLIKQDFAYNDQKLLVNLNSYVDPLMFNSRVLEKYIIFNIKASNLFSGSWFETLPLCFDFKSILLFLYVSNLQTANKKLFITKYISNTPKIVIATSYSNYYKRNLIKQSIHSLPLISEKTELNNNIFFYKNKILTIIISYELYKLLYLNLVFLWLHQKGKKIIIILN